jgi:hypothetical protein
VVAVSLSHTKVLCTAFKCLHFGFVIFWLKEFGAKAAHKMLVKLTPGACIIKLITAVIYGFRNKLECLSLNTRLCWKGLPGQTL